MHKFKHLSIATEAIDFQNGSFFKELSLAFTPYCTKQSSLSRNDYDELAGLLDKIISRHTGINSSAYFSHQGTCVYVPDIDASNPILGAYSSFSNSKDGLELIEKATGKAGGLVDIDKSKVSGVFSKIVVKINIQYSLLNTGSFSAEEVASILLHEIGHYFVYCEMLDKAVMGNFVLMGLDKALRGNPDPTKREIIIKKAGEALNFERDVVENIKKSSSDKVVTTLFITEFGSQRRTQSKDVFYDLNSWEMVADQFAARHGAGRHLVTALDKIYAMYGVGVRQGKYTFYVFQIVRILGLISGMIFAVVSGVTGGAFNLIFGVFIFTYCYLILRTSHQQGGAPLYDKPLDRALRVRRQLIEYSKKNDLPKEVIEQLVKDVKLIDETVSDYSDRTTWLEYIDQYLFNSSRRRADNAQLQKDLEKLAMNDLFLSSAELKYL